jgi:hypothetical protein
MARSRRAPAAGDAEAVRWSYRPRPVFPRARLSRVPSGAREKLSQRRAPEGARPPGAWMASGRSLPPRNGSSTRGVHLSVLLRASGSLPTARRRRARPRALALCEPDGPDHELPTPPPIASAAVSLHGRRATSGAARGRRSVLPWRARELPCAPLPARDRTSRPPRRLPLLGGARRPARAVRSPGRGRAHGPSVEFSRTQETPRCSPGTDDRSSVAL